MVMKIGVLALQGAISEHLTILSQIGVEPIPVKYAQQLDLLDGLIIPGGESTAINQLITENQLYQPIRHFALKGKAIFGTCAGLIMCATTIMDNNQTNQRIKPLSLLEITVKRNAFGRQLESFETTLDIKDIGQDVPAVFIRAPYIQSVSPNVEVLAKFDGNIVMAKQGSILVSSFHPELTNDIRILRYFKTLVK
ncbi:MAG: pyridoxal 5'-phosphate synthase glutaminase subunit PdxT [Candidatus Schmidhempelia sp.]|nr:pyridoxal 5'-phosphate synthase glutaminase subunit PdxT [Candidatus Schmidhempelia sp.]